MATKLYKNGEGQFFPTDRVQRALSDGWDVELNIPTKEEADTNHTGKLSNKEVRDAARLAGLEDWNTSRIKALKKALGYDQS